MNFDDVPVFKDPTEMSLNVLEVHYKFSKHSHRFQTDADYMSLSTNHITDRNVLEVILNSENTKIKSRVELGEEKQANQPVKKVPVELPPEPKSESGSGKWSPSYDRSYSRTSDSHTEVNPNRKFSRTMSILDEHPFFVQKRNSRLFTEFPSF